MICPKMQFSASSVGTRRGIVEYLNTRYRLDIVPSFTRAMYFTSQRGGGGCNLPVSNSLFRLRHAQPGSNVQQYFMFFTKSIGNQCRSSIVLLNRCIDVAYIVTGIVAPDCFFSDTLVECEMEAPNNMCISDILIWQGAPLFDPAASSKFTLPFHPHRLNIIAELMKCIRGTGCGTVHMDMATWYQSLDDVMLVYIFDRCDTTHLVARSNRKTVYQKDAMTSFQPPSDQHAAVASSGTCNNNVTHHDDMMITNGDGEVVANNVIRNFYVHATGLPDVFELYSDKSMIGVLESPEAVACVRSMQDSELLRNNQGCVMKFEYIAHLQKWIPFRV